MDIKTSPQHLLYRDSLRRRARALISDPLFSASLSEYALAFVVFVHLDLEPVRAALSGCYATKPRGEKPRDPIIMFRSVLLAVLLGMGINTYVKRLKADRLLQMIIGLRENCSPPGVGTHYDMLHRIQDGPRAALVPGVERPSEVETRGATSPRRLDESKKKKKEKEQVTTRNGKKKNLNRGQRKRIAKEAEKIAMESESAATHDESMRVTEKVVRELDLNRDSSNPQDLTTRLNTMLLDLVGRISAQKGLFGDVKALTTCGDGSAIPTGASGLGKKVCPHHRGEHCDCPRKYADPEAQRGYDAYRKVNYFGYHFFEIGTGAARHDLPLMITLEPANYAENVMGLQAYDRFQKLTRELGLDWRIAKAVLDAGHDAEPVYRYFFDREITPFIPLKRSAPAVHPERPDVKLSQKGIPLCDKGKAEMAPWGSSGFGHPIFVCPVKAGKLDRCPLAPPDDPTWTCEKGDLAPTITLNTKANPRLSPPVQRNSKTFEETYKQRTSCERGNSTKKGPFDLVGARHRRRSFWFIRVVAIAILQHVKTWVADIDQGEFINQFLGIDREKQPA